MAGCEDRNLVYDKLDFWDHVYGIDMKCMKKWVLHEPIIDVVPS